MVGAYFSMEPGDGTTWDLIPFQYPQVNEVLLLQFLLCTD